MDIGRRGFLKLMGGGAAAVGSGKAVYNVFLGYGTNLLNQDLTALASSDLPPTDETVRVRGREVEAGPDSLTVYSGDGELLATVGFYESGGKASEAGRRLGVGSALTELHRDVPVLRNEDYRMEFMRLNKFFDYLEDRETRGYTVEYLRDGYGGVDPGVVGEFTEADPRSPRRVLESLVPRFREATSYDVPRYVAGSITDNVLMRVVRLRPYFRHDVDYEALVSNEETRLFCYEYVDRSVEALHSVPAPQQSPPVFGGTVIDRRHKHAYTAVGSVVSGKDGLVVPVSFVDYTRTTLYSDLGVAGLLGSEVNAYDSHHRATRIEW